MKTGLVVTSTMSHATPASFSAHADDRNKEAFIAEQQSRAGIDVLFGGGKKYWVDRSDNRDLLDEMKNRDGLHRHLHRRRACPHLPGSRHWPLCRRDDGVRN